MGRWGQLGVRLGWVMWTGGLRGPPGGWEQAGAEVAAGVQGRS